VASIGPETSRTLLELGLEPDAEAKTHTMEGLVEVVERARRQRSV
jgi:uroporphyrinogen-III synthase